MHETPQKNGKVFLVAGLICIKLGPRLIFLVIGPNYSLTQVSSSGSIGP
jgi:hypothetical protein